MTRLRHNVRVFLKHFDDYAVNIHDVLYAALRLSDTTFAHLSSEQQDRFAKQIITALREAIAHQCVETLLDTILHGIQEHHAVSLDDIHTLVNVIRCSAFAALAPLVRQDTTVGIVGLDLIASVLEQVSSTESQRRLHQLEAQLTEHHDTSRMFRAIVENSANGIVLLDSSGNILYANPSFLNITRSPNVVQGISLWSFVEPAYAEEVSEMYLAHTQCQKIIAYHRKDGTLFHGHTTLFPISDSKELHQQYVAIIHDVSYQLLPEEISTPLMWLEDDIVAIPLVGKIDPIRAQQIVDMLLEGIATHRARVAIVDVSGLPNIDSQVANMLVLAAQAMRLLGACVVLTGISPRMAITLVQLGADMRGIVTFSRFRKGVAYAMKHRQDL